MLHPMSGCIFFILGALLVGYPAWRIAEKMGYQGVMGLIALIPLVNLFVVWYVALNEWPVENELRRWRASVPAAPPAYPPPPYAPPPPPPPPVGG